MYNLILKLGVLSIVSGLVYVSCDICATVYPRAADFRLSNFTKSPYYLIQSDNFYNDDQPILVEIGGSSFRGFLLAAVDPLTGRRIGSFVETQGIFTLPCSAAIHSDYHLKKHALLMWRPPRHSKGFVAFEITLMDEMGRFLVGQISILPHQLFTHLQMIPVYTRAPSPQLSASYPASSVTNFPESSSSSSSSLLSPPPPYTGSVTPSETDTRYNVDGVYRFVPILIPNLSQQSQLSPGNGEADTAAQSFYLSAESALQPQSLLPAGRRSHLPCSDKTAAQQQQQHQQLMQASASNQDITAVPAPTSSSSSSTLQQQQQQQQQQSSSSLSSSSQTQPQSQSGSPNLVPNTSGNAAAATQLPPSSGPALINVAALSHNNHHQNQPFNQLLGKLLHSMAANNQQKK